MKNCCLLAILLMGIGWCHYAVAETFTVTSLDDAGPGTLRQSILDMNAANGNVHTIRFDTGMSGTVTLSQPLPAINKPVVALRATDAQISINFAGFEGLVLQAVAPSFFTLEDIALNNGNARTGGCLRDIFGATVSVARVAFNRCEAVRLPGQITPRAAGGAIEARGNLQVIDSSFFANSVNDTDGTAFGGAIYFANSVADLEIINSAFVANLAVSAADGELGSGSAVSAPFADRVSIIDSWFIDNDDDIGAVAVFPTSAEIRGNVFSRQQTRSLYVGPSGPAQLENNVFWDNQSGMALFVASGTLAMRHNLFSGNRSFEEQPARPADLFVSEAVVVEAFSHNVFAKPVTGITCGATSLLAVTTAAGSNNYFTDESCEPFLDLGLTFDTLQISSTLFDLSGLRGNIPLPYLESPIIGGGASQVSASDFTQCSPVDVRGEPRLAPCSAGPFEPIQVPGVVPSSAVFADDFE